MSLHTPKQRGAGLRQPSFGTTNTASSPSLRATMTDVNRKASLRALTGTGNGGQGTPGSSSKMGDDLEVGDVVTVPGDMFGIVKFVGTVRGKNGSFVGVELDRQFAAKGKNDGDVEGTQYFNTTIPGAGIFLPVHRAEKRNSPTQSIDSYPATPQTPSYSTVNGRRTKDGYTPPTPALPHKFSQSVGPGARPRSPTFKARRPSLPRPESPMRKPPTLAPTPSARTVSSQSTRGGRPALGPTPSKSSLKSSTLGRPPASAPGRPYSRTGSRIGHRNDTIDEDRTPSGTIRSASNFSNTLRSPSRLGSAGGQDVEIRRLRDELAERDRRLEEQANNLAEMDASVKELSALIPTDGSSPGGSRGMDDDDKSAAQLRQALREKNEKISMLTSEFDAHRADFRSTLDSLEMASTETERVYEEQKRDLLAQVAELQESAGAQSRDDFESVANQLKQLEELVAELEEGLEESRRGEAEARGEVEFLRGEVERGRSELRREREKAAAAFNDHDGGSFEHSKEIEQRDDEIRGLKALIHSLSDGSSTPGSPNGKGNAGADPEELQRLQAALDESRLEREDLEKELEQLRRDTAVRKTNGVHARNASDLTEKGLPTRPRGDTVKASFADRTRQQILEEDVNGEHETADEDDEKDEIDGVFCELCKSAEHDTLDCTQLKMDRSDSRQQQRQQSDGLADMPKPLALDREQDEPRPLSSSASKSDVKDKDEDKWCALCEKDGHLAFDCPDEQY